MICSAPMRPRPESRSVNAVNPEMSAKTRVASMLRHTRPGASSSQRSAIGGMWRRRSCIPNPSIAWPALGASRP